MPRGLLAPAERARSTTHERDAGITLIEISISIVLLAIAVTAMLTMLTVTISASATERDHANAHAWLQTGADVLYGEDRVACTEPQSTIVGTYNGHVKGTSNPEGWDSSNIEVLGPVLFWDGDVYQSTCYEAEGILLQLITIEVRNPDGEIVETVQVVKG